MAGVDLPADLTARPATVADADDIYHLIAACEADLDGRVEIDPDDVMAMLTYPSMDLERHSVVVHESTGRLVAAGTVFREFRIEADVHPDRRGEGIGTWLLGWAHGRAQPSPDGRIIQSVTDNNHAAAALFAAHGYQPTHVAWILAIDMAEEPDLPEPPAGVTVRPFVPGQDDRAVHRVVDDAFAGWPDRTPVTFDEWFASVSGRETFAAHLSPVAVRGDRIIGAALCMDIDDQEGYLHQLAVVAAERGQGIGGLLLRHAFAAQFRQGRRSCSLSTNDFTGALPLYEKAGMRVRNSYTRYAKTVTNPGS